MEKTSTSNKPSSNYNSQEGVRNIANLDNYNPDVIGVLVPNPLVVSNIINYARALEVLKSPNKMVFYFVKN